MVFFKNVSFSHQMLPQIVAPSRFASVMVQAPTTQLLQQMQQFKSSTVQDTFTPSGVTTASQSQAQSPTQGQAEQQAMPNATPSVAANSVVAFTPPELKPLDPLTLIKATQPVVAPLTPNERWLMNANAPLRHWQTQQLNQNLTVSGETLNQRQAMLLRLEQVLPAQEQQALNQLLQAGKLTQTTGDDPHSTLYHLYALISTPRASGFQPVGLLRSTLALLSRPNNPHQDYTPLDTNLKQQLKTMLENPSYDAHQSEAPVTLPEEAALDIVDSNNCAAASEQSRLASKSAKELARMVNQLTAPAMTLLEKATAKELTPENPEFAEELLKQARFLYHKLPDGSFLLQLPAPRLAVPRALAAQAMATKNPELASKVANPVEVLLQDTLLYNFTCHSHNAATDARDSLDMAAVGINLATSLNDEQKQQLVGVLQTAGSWQEARENLLTAVKALPNLSAVDLINIVQGSLQESYGLTDMEKTLMERVMEDGEPMSSVLYQIEGGASQATPYNQGDLYVYGYSRPLDAMTKDLTTALDAGHEVILGMASTASGKGATPQGKSIGGHEIKVMGYRKDPTTGEAIFKIADSDRYYYDEETGSMQAHRESTTAAEVDGRWEPASSLIPKIHHMGLPYSQASAIWEEMKQNPSSYYLPDTNDVKRYNLIALSPETPPDTLGLPGEQLAMNDLAEQEAKQQTALACDPYSESATKALAPLPPPPFKQKA